jgi:hypothetical protein
MSKGRHGGWSCEWGCAGHDRWRLARSHAGCCGRLKRMSNGRYGGWMGSFAAWCKKEEIKQMLSR